MTENSGRSADSADLRRKLQGVIERPFKSYRFADEASEALRDLILSGTLEQGERINEVVLAEQLGISRTPIREALQALAGENLVQFIAGRGAFVAVLDAEAVTELVEVRTALECYGARLAAERISDDQLAALGGMLKKTEGAVERDGRGYPGDLDFHMAVLDATGNSRLVQAAMAVNTQLRLARVWSGLTPGRATAAFAEHEAVYAALARHDAAATERAMRRHLERAAKNVESLLAERDATAG